MHTLPVLQKFFAESFPEIHVKRREALAGAVDAISQGAAATVTSMGRRLRSITRIKRRIKRMDRLIGNPQLSAERKRFYHVITRRLISGCPVSSF
jgi:hypothetical protein